MQVLPCTIDSLTDRKEICWLITLTSAVTSAASLLFSALHLGMISEVRFRDPQTKETVTIHTDNITFGTQTVSITPSWFEALWHLLLRTALNGWTDTSHIDGTFPTANGEISITFAITP